jgi:hypothetical protein
MGDTEERRKKEEAYGTFITGALTVVLRACAPQLYRKMFTGIDYKQYFFPKLVEDVLVGPVHDALVLMHGAHSLLLS